MVANDSTKRERISGGLWGSVVGDALGVPVEFLSRADVRIEPVTGMRGFGTHRQPAGTWSDDSSMLLCTVESLFECEIDTEDMGARFVRWSREGLWTPHGRVFDMGVTTSEALSRIASGTPAELAGGDGQFTNGNGSLMRMAPIPLRFAGEAPAKLLDRVQRVSAITHRHARAQMACGLFALVVVELLKGHPPFEAYTEALGKFRAHYESDKCWAQESDYFRMLLAGDLASREEKEIDSSGYVLHTLTASLWCLLTTESYRDCVLKAVNLGGDTDTTGCVAGGLAGVTYGMKSIPKEWIESLARMGEIEQLLARFGETCEGAANGVI